MTTNPDGKRRTPAPSGPDREPSPPSDPVIEAYKQHVDRTLLRGNLRKTPEERVRALMALQRLAEEARRAGRSLRP
jgi:hypothetical protein